ncbi:hypothetical protein K474DRAFT_1711448 [Panus rudis PR-1116 ss-1]|nr:hypothetical protein K474DRAFT_1711448 [Panus rudis PR-1116 ss-1]
MVLTLLDLLQVTGNLEDAQSRARELEAALETAQAAAADAEERAAAAQAEAAEAIAAAQADADAQVAAANAAAHVAQTALQAAQAQAASGKTSSYKLR